MKHIHLSIPTLSLLVCECQGEWVNLTDIDLFSPATFFPYGKAIARDDQVSGGEHQSLCRKRGGLKGIGKNVTKQ